MLLVKNEIIGIELNSALNTCKQNLHFSKRMIKFFFFFLYTDKCTRKQTAYKYGICHLYLTRPAHKIYNPEMKHA